MSTKSLTELAEEKVLSELQKAVHGFEENANYCCGGSIPIAVSDDSSAGQKESVEGK